MHLFDLIKSALRYHRPVNESGWVEYEGFACIYARAGRRFFYGTDQFVPCVDLANIKARCPGQGAFRALVRELQTRYPDLFIYVEQVSSHRFEEGLRRMGFEADEVQDSSYWLTPEYFQLAGVSA